MDIAEIQGCRVKLMSLNAPSETHFSPLHTICTCAYVCSHTCLGFACGATGVQDEERVLSITPLRLTLIPCVLHEFMPPQVNILIPRDLQEKKGRNGQKWAGKNCEQLEMGAGETWHMEGLRWEWQAGVVEGRKGPVRVE